MPTNADTVPAVRRENRTGRTWLLHESATEMPTSLGKVLESPSPSTLRDEEPRGHVVARPPPSCSSALNEVGREEFGIFALGRDPSSRAAVEDKS